MAIELDDDAQDAISRLFALINLGDSAQTSRQFSLFEEALEDAESFIGCLNQLCERIDLEVDWGTEDTEDEDFLEGTSVPELMEIVATQLRMAGYTLWNWDTGGDAYGGWITRSEDDEEMMEIADTLGFDIRPGDQPY